MKLTKRIKKKVRNYAIKISDFVKPNILSRNYLGYKLFYSKGTSLIERLSTESSIYESETTDVILQKIRDIKKPVILDIGANIGLISLNILKFKDDAYIYAFEPGPHQFMLFEKTIKENNLYSKINLFKIALSDKCGLIDFYIHNTKHASGDGMYDTLRAGDCSKISVESNSLDNWWNENGKPKVDLLKIDTEGAELFIFNGGEQMIKNCKPIIISEMSELNYKSYPYSFDDVFLKIKSLGYDIYYDIDNKELIESNIKDVKILPIDTFLCIPK